MKLIRIAEDLQAPETAKNTLQAVKDYFTDPALWSTIVLALIKIAVIWIVGRVVVNISKKAIDHMMTDREKSPLRFDVRRTRTIGRLVSNVISYTVNFIVILLVLNQLGFNLGPLLAGAGVIGLAIGFGAQSLVKDVITGFFIIFEDQFGVGDTVQIGTYKGVVEEIGLRVTRLKSWTGEEHIIPNGTIGQVTNFSVHNSMAVVDIKMALDANIERTKEVLRECALRVAHNNANVVKEPDVLGVQDLGQSDVVIRVVAECQPNKAASVERSLKAEIKEALEREKAVAHGT